MDTLATSQAHTAGKWTAEKRANWIIRSAEKQIATVSFTDSEEEHEANARFIVTACNSHQELLEACKMLLSLVDDEGNAELLMQNDFGNLNEAMLYARPAIAKAEGSSIVS